MHRFVSYKSYSILPKYTHSWNRNLWFSVVIVLKMFYKKQKRKIIQYRNNKTFNQQLFRTELNKQLGKIDLNNGELAELLDEFLSVINKHAPIKYKYIRANHSSYLIKSLRIFVLDYAISFLRPN